MMQNFEKNGLVNLTLAAHSCERPPDVLVGTVPDHYIVKNKSGLAWRPQNVAAKSLKQTNIASFFSRGQLEKGALELVWRMRLYKKEGMVAPAKPLWYIKAAVVLTNNQAVRLA